MGLGVGVGIGISISGLDSFNPGIWSYGDCIGVNQPNAFDLICGSTSDPNIAEGFWRIKATNNTGQTIRYRVGGAPQVTIPSGQTIDQVIEVQDASNGWLFMQSTSDVPVIGDIVNIACIYVGPLSSADNVVFGADNVVFGADNVVFGE